MSASRQLRPVSAQGRSSRLDLRPLLALPPALRRTTRPVFGRIRYPLPTSGLRSLPPRREGRCHGRHARSNSRGRASPRRRRRGAARKDGPNLPVPQHAQEAHGCRLLPHRSFDSSSRRQADAGYGSRPTRIGRQADRLRARSPPPDPFPQLSGPPDRPGSTRSQASRRGGCSRRRWRGHEGSRARASQGRTSYRRLISRKSFSLRPSGRRAAASRQGSSPRGSLIVPPASTAVETVRIAARARTAPTGVVSTTAGESSSIELDRGREAQVDGARQASCDQRAVPGRRPANCSWWRRRRKRGSRRPRCAPGRRP